MSRIPLTREYALNNIGNTIDWFCYGYHHNLPYSGRSKILEVTGDKIVSEGTGPFGDSLSYGWFENDVLNYTDSGRVVYVGKEFENYTLQWEVPSMDYLFSNDTPMNYSITLYLDSGKTIEDLILANTKAEEVRVKETGDYYRLTPEGYQKIIRH